MLNQLNTEALNLLNGRPIVRQALDILRWMSPTRQVEAAKLMVSTGNFSRNFAQALLVASEPEDRVKMRSRPIVGLSQEQKVKMQRELRSLLNDLEIMERHGADMLCLLVASGYISKLINNREIESYLGQNHPEILQDFRTIVTTLPLDASSAEGGYQADEH